MRGSYAYSFDRESFHGTYRTRDEAFRAALEHIELVGPDLVVYVGQRSGGDPQARGHARHVVKEMKHRARQAVGDAARDYLRDVTAEQLKDLDGALESAIVRWLANYKLEPKFDKISAISEHPIPNAPQVAAQTDKADTVTVAWGHREP